MKPNMDTVFSKGKLGLGNVQMSTSNGSPDVDHRQQSADIPAEETSGNLDQALKSSSEEVKRPTVRSMKIFFEAMVKAEAAKKFAANIALQEEIQLLDDKTSKTASPEENTTSTTPFRVHDLPLQHSDLVSHGQEHRTNETEGVARLQGFYQANEDQDLLPAAAALAKSPLSGLHRVSSLKTAQDSPIPSVAAQLGSQTNISDSSSPIRRHPTKLSMDPASGLVFPPSPPLTPQRSNSQNIDSSPRLTGLTAMNAPSPFRRLSLGTSSMADNPTTKFIQETRDNTIEGSFDSFLATPPDTPVRFESHFNPIHESTPKAVDSHAAEVQELRDQLASAMHELQVAKDETVVYKNSAIEINKDIEGLIKRLNTMTDAHRSLVQSHQRTNSELEIVRVDHSTLLAEKRGWHEQFDVLKQKVVEVERTNSDLEIALADSRRLIAEQRGFQEQLEAMNHKVAQADRTKSKLELARADSKKLRAEKSEWEEQFDLMHHKVLHAERQIRCMDTLTKGRFESRQDDIFGPPKRTKKLASLPTDLSAQAVRLVASLNIEIQESATFVVENYRERAASHESQPPISVVHKAKKMLGEDLTKILQAQASMNKSGFYQLLLVVILKVYLVHWCSAIIEGWYPKRPSFSDLLVEHSLQTGAASSKSSSRSGKRIRVIETQSASVVSSSQMPAWVAEAFKDLSDILMIGGLTICDRQFSSEIGDLFRLAYDVRAALAEKDMCGVELVVEEPGAPFHSRWMDEDHALTRKGTVETFAKMESIVGTTSMGLKRMAKAGKNEGHTYLLKPKVVKARILWNKSLEASGLKFS